MSQPREVPETEGGDRCHRDGWHGLMAQTDVPATENQDGWPIHLSLSVLCVCVCVSVLGTSVCVIRLGLRRLRDGCPRYETKGVFFSH